MFRIPKITQKCIVCHDPHVFTYKYVVLKKNAKKTTKVCTV